MKRRAISFLLISTLLLSFLGSSPTWATQTNDVNIDIESNQVKAKAEDPVSVIEIPDMPTGGSGVTNTAVYNAGPYVNPSQINGSPFDGSGSSYNPVTGVNGGSSGVNNPGFNNSDIRNTGGNNPGFNQIDSGNIGGNKTEVHNPGVQGAPTTQALTWRESLWNSINSFLNDPSPYLRDFGIKLGRGLVVGVIGAGVVVGVVVGVASLVGVTIAAPVIVAGLVVGIAVGVAYSFGAGNNFSFVKGLAYSGVGALLTLAIAEAGGVALFRNAVTGLRNGITLLRTAPATFIRKHILNTGTVSSFTVNLLWNFYDCTNGFSRRPTPSEGWGMLGSAIIGALVFDKLGKVLSSQTANRISKRVIEGVVSGADNFSTNLLMGKEQQPGGFAATMVSSIFVKSHLDGFFKGVRKRLNIGTTKDELIKMGIDPVVARDLPSKRIQKKLGIRVTNNQIDKLWQTGEVATASTINRLKRRGGKVKEIQLIRLEENQKRYRIIAVGEASANAVLKAGEKVVGDFLDKNVLSEDNLKSIDKAFNEVCPDPVATETDIK